ncbi:MAG: 1-acyl-sn-glycerol-3-phosphate acyltransferase [Flavobacteriia bacterium]|jgi:putative hemolysin
MEEKNFIDIKRLIGSKNPRLLKWLPGFIIKYLERILHQKEINQFLKENPGKKNQEFCSAVVDLLQMKIEIKGIENIPKTGGATLAMNHPLGGMDALALVHILKEHRTDIKYIVNDLLLQLEPLKELFVGVNKHGKNNEGTFQKMDDLFKSDQLIGVFPAGLVSRKSNGKVRDLEWKKTFITLSKKGNNPIIPIYIDGKMSNFFYRLANFRKFLGIKANVEMLYLANELFKQKNVTVTFTVGKPIYPDDINSSMSLRAWANEIRERVYKLSK